MSPEIRIGAGTWKGRKIYTFSKGYRPTTALVKKSLFDSIGIEIEGSRFLDLFAGAGAVGIEALSRGASFVTFIENDLSRIKTLERNMGKLEVDRKSVEILPMDYSYALTRLRERDQKFDFIYVDPPYDSSVPQRILGNIVTSRVLAEEGLLIYETARNDVRDILEKAPQEIYPVRERDHGGTALLIFRWRDAEKISCK